MNNFLFLIYPLLFAVYPILFLYSHNVEEATLSQLIIPLLAAFVITYLIWVITFLLVKDKVKTGLITSVFILAFFSYGHVFEILLKSDLPFMKHRFILPSFLFVSFYLSYFISKANQSDIIKSIYTKCSLLVLFLICINLTTIMLTEAKQLASSKQIVNQTKQQIKQDSNSPDIYYLIFDEYASPSTLREFWGYDNRPFIDYLEQKGFFVTKSSVSNYNFTYKSIASSLNMDYLKTDRSEDIYKLITENKVQQYLRSKGYKYIYLGNWYDITRYKTNPDYEFNYYLDKKMSYVDEFSKILLNSTMLDAFSYLFRFSYDSNNEFRNYISYDFEKLKQMPQMVGPKFVFAHIISPHQPFVFGENGEEINPINQENWKDKKFYLNQLKYLNKQIEDLVPVLLTKSKNPPIIIIQSDHGPRPNISPRPEESFIIPEKEMFKVFNAYYFPDRNYSMLNESISPINSFRVIFNKYFGEQYKLMETQAGDSHEP